MTQAILQFAHGDAEWHKLRQRCLTDLYWFAGVVLGYGDRLHMHPRVHGLYCKFLERNLGLPELDDAPIQLGLMPRDTGKSTLGAQARVLQKVLQNPNTSILIAAEKLDLAVKFLGAIKAEMLNNQLLRELWPDVIPDPEQTVWAEDKIVVKRTQDRKEPTIFCIGAGGSVTGMHPDGVVCDDLFTLAALENAKSGVADLSGRINRWISQLRPLLSAWAEPFPWILFNGTRWFAGDPYEYVEEAFGYGEAPRHFRITVPIPNEMPQTLTITRVGDVAIFKRAAIEDGKSIWPENPKFTLEALARWRLTDPQGFAANMMNNPTDELTATFKESWLRWFEWLDARTLKLHHPNASPTAYSLADLDVQMIVDPGGFKQGRGSDRARPAILITGTAPDQDRHCLLTAWSESTTYQQAMEQMFALLTRYPVRKMWIEVAGQQIVFFDNVRKAMQERHITHVSLEAVKTENVNKDNRILGLEPYFQRGEIFIERGPNSAEFQEQYRRYSPETPQKRRDLLDCLAYGPRVWRKRRGGPMDTQRRQQQERQQYYQRRGIAMPRSA